MQLAKMELEHVIMFHNGKPKKLKTIIKIPTLEVRGYLISKQVGRSLLKKIYATSKLESSQKPIWDLPKKIILGTMKLFFLIHKIGTMKII
jgi:hypothetical protein